MMMMINKELLIPPLVVVDDLIRSDFEEMERIKRYLVVRGFRLVTEDLYQCLLFDGFVGDDDE